MTDRFPLLRLPHDALKSALRSMEPLQLVMLTFFSNRVKSLVASINMKAEVNAVVSSHFRICAKVGEQLFQWVFYHELKNGIIPIKISNPELVFLAHTVNDQIESDVVPKIMDIPNWFNHIKAIFNCPKISQLQFFEDVGNFDLDSIRDSMIQEDIHELVVSAENSDECNRKIMKTFPYTKHLSLEAEVYENGKPPGEVLIQHFSRFNIGLDSGNPTTMKLDDILMMNAKNVVIAFSKLTEKDANRFLKLWMRGKSKFEYIGFTFANGMVVDKNIVLKGIKFQEIPIEKKRFFPGVINPIEGGIDVVRRDGTNGTIRFGNRFMVFFVWHDGCEVEKK